MNIIKGLSLRENADTRRPVSAPPRHYPVLRGLDSFCFWWYRGVITVTFAPRVAQTLIFNVCVQRS
jgi:hypothetical protein